MWCCMVNVRLQLTGDAPVIGMLWLGHDGSLHVVFCSSRAPLLVSHGPGSVHGLVLCSPSPQTSLHILIRHDLEQRPECHIETS